MGCYKKDARELLDHFTDVVSENVGAGRKVQYASLGIFYPTMHGRSAVKRLKIRFRPARELSERVAGSGNITTKEEGENNDDED